MRIVVGGHGFKTWIAYIIFPPDHSGTGSNPGRQKLVTLLMSPKDYLFYPNLFCSAKVTPTGSLKDCKITTLTKLFFLSQWIGGSVGRAVRRSRVQALEGQYYLSLRVLKMPKLSAIIAWQSGKTFKAFFPRSCVPNFVTHSSFACLKKKNLRAHTKFFCVPDK